MHPYEPTIRFDGHEYANADAFRRQIVKTHFPIPADPSLPAFMNNVVVPAEMDMLCAERDAIGCSGEFDLQKNRNWIASTGTKIDGMIRLVASRVWDMNTISDERARTIMASLVDFRKELTTCDRLLTIFIDKDVEAPMDLQTMCRTCSERYRALRTDVFLLG